MDSCHGNPSPSDPMESVCRHFPPPPHLHRRIFTKSLANCLAVVRWTLATATRLHRIRWSPFADIFHPLLTYIAVYLLSLSRTVSRWSDGLLPRQPVSIGSDGVGLPTFSTPSSAILCCIFTKSLANCLPVSLVAHGLLPSDSVWVYWTTLPSDVLMKQLDS